MTLTCLVPCLFPIPFNVCFSLAAAASTHFYLSLDTERIIGSSEFFISSAPKSSSSSGKTNDGFFDNEEPDRKICHRNF